MFEPLHLALQSLRFRLLCFAGRQCFGQAGRQVLGASLAELPGADVELRRYLRQPLAAVQQPLTACVLNSLVKLRRVRLSAILSSWGAWVR